MTFVNITFFIKQVLDQDRQVDQITTVIDRGISKAKVAIDASLKQNNDATQTVLRENRDALKNALTSIHVDSNKSLNASLTQGRSALEATIAASHLDQRPWIKIEPRISEPLTFDVGGRASGRNIAMATIESVIENVGKTVANRVFTWMDVIPVDAGHSLKSALTRQREYCDANRDPKLQTLSGYTLFPRQPLTEQSVVGPTMDRIAQAMAGDKITEGKVAFVLVGCVSYRAPFEPPNTPTHQTRFVYHLGYLTGDGLLQMYVVPAGVASQLRLVQMPLNFTAD